MVLAPGSDSSVAISSIDPRSEIYSSWPLPGAEDHHDTVREAETTRTDVANAAIQALNKIDVLMQDITLAISTQNPVDIDRLDGRTYGINLAGDGSSGDTLATALITTRAQGEGGLLTDMSMKWAQKPLEAQKKLSGQF